MLLSAAGWDIWYSQHLGGLYSFVSIRVPLADKSSRPNYVQKLTKSQSGPSAAGLDGSANWVIH
jgi:hypothetical protein